MKTKTASVRLPENMYEEIDNLCNDIGCTRNDWIKDTLKDKLGTQLDENNQVQENQSMQELKPTVTEIFEDKPRSKGIITKIIDSNGLDYISELRNVIVSD